MSRGVTVAGWAATSIGILPLAMVGVQRPTEPAWWWLTAAFGVSAVADLGARLWNAPFFVSPLYTVSQSALIGAVFLVRGEALRFVLAMTVAGIVSAWLHRQPDVLLHTVAWGGVVGIVYDRWQLGHLRTALLVAFGLGLLAWWGYVMVPGWPTWLLYQSTRLWAAVLFCYAVTHDTPRLRLA